MKQTTVFTTLTLVHKAMLTGQVIFTAIIFYLVYSKTMLPVLASQEKTLQGIALLSAVIALFAGTKLFKKKLELIKEDIVAGAKEKLVKYRSASLLQWGLVELPCLVCGVCLLLTGNYAFLALAIVIILYFAILMPVKNKIADQLNLSSAELDEL